MGINMQHGIPEIDELLKAMATLEAQRAALGDRVVDAALAPLREKLAELEQQQSIGQQRRLVTVLFLDIVNSTMMSQGLEPEEILEIMGGALKRLSAPVETYGGQVYQFTGDGFVAVFGLPRVHENDARQAVRAGLKILEEARASAEELERRFQILGFNVRIGINTGRVVVGKLSKNEPSLVGLMMSLAARVEQAALPGTLFISQFTLQHVHGAFEIEPLPPVDAKGFPQPVAVYRVLSERPRTFRTFTRGVEGVEPRLIGRQAELGLLQGTFTRTVQGQEAQLVTIMGEAGVGKSRLLYEFDRWVAQQPLPLVAFKARAVHQTMNVPFGMLREMISYHLGILTTDPVELTRQRVEQALSKYLTEAPQMKAHFVGSLLGFDFSGSAYLQGVEGDPKQFHKRAQLYLTEYLAAIAHKNAVILLLDDIHWADPPSLNFITQLAREHPRLSLLVVCLARPILIERFPNWGREEGREQPLQPTSPTIHKHLHLNVEPLSRGESRELLGEILRSVEALPTALYEQILDNADGNPFYIEEYIQALVDAEAIRPRPHGGPWMLDHERLDCLDLPATLIALLEARLDSLTAAQRALVQQASVVGRVFWRSALQTVRGDKAIARAELRLLSRRGFFSARETSTFSGTEEYIFHHGLLRDVAYQTLLKSDRQTYHEKAAAWLIGATQARGRVGEFAPVIAEHYESAGAQTLAADWYTQSGKRARNQGAPAQARTFYDRALALLPAAPQRPQTEDDLMKRWQALRGRDEVLGILGDTEARQEDDLALVALAQLIGDDNLLAEAYYRQGYTQGMIGQYSGELEAYTQGLAAARRANDRRHEALILGLKVMCEARLGLLDAAAQSCVEALTCVENLDDDEALARTLTNVSSFFSEMGDLARAAQLLERQLTIIRRIGNLEGEAVGLSNLGYTYTLLGMPEDGIAALRRGMELAQTIGHRSFRAYCGLNLALACLRSGDTAASLFELEQVLPELQAMNDTFGYAVGQTYAALAREQCGQIEEALAGFEQAAASLEGIGTPGNANDAQAGAARCQLALKDLEAAQRVAIPLWNYLDQQDGAGMEFPLLGYETCIAAFSVAGHASLARQVTEAGYRQLMARANRISLTEWRQSFLERVPEHHRIISRWQESLATEPRDK